MQKRLVTANITDAVRKTTAFGEVLEHRKAEGHIEIEGLSVEDSTKVATFGFMKQRLVDFQNRGQMSSHAQFFGLIKEGLIMTRHCFKGLNRPLFCDGNENGDETKFVFARKPAYDYAWRHDFLFELAANGLSDGSHVRFLAPAGCVFVVYMSLNIKHKEAFPNIEAWIESWAWVKEEPELSEAPENWLDRYSAKSWTREEAKF